MTTVRQRRVGKGTEAAEDQPSEETNVKPDGKILPDHPGGKLWSILSITLGGIVAICLGLLTSVYVATLHENDLWFSNIKEVEREISFRTECGLYYSYYKQMIQAASIQQGLHGLVYDNKTESVRTINILERMNVYQEVFLSILYRILPIQQYLEPVYFYIYTLFGLQAVYVIALYVTSWLLSGTWLSGLLAACWYITNRVDTTRVEFTIPLRENWALPFFAVQIAAITYLLRTHLQPAQERLTLMAVFIATFLFSLTWQFNQFMMLIQALALFILDCLDMLPTAKVTWLYIIQISGLLLVCVLQFFNSMILGSLLISFNVSVLIARTIQKNLKKGGLLDRLGKLILHVLLVLCLTLLINKFIKKILNLESDEHIFKFLKAKFGFGATRMKYLWTSHMCVFASFGLCSTEVWKLILKCLHLYTSQRTQVIKYSIPIITLLYISFKFWPGIMDELSELREFYDPDTVELMNWIKSNTPNTAVFAGSMQLLAGVKLCTGRTLTNHPHYEDKNLRERTKQIYQIYAKRSPGDVHGILRSFGTDYVILEDSICYERRHSRGCRLRDLLDVANGHIMDGLGENEPDLKPSLYPRFCEEIKKNLPSYTMHFTRVFQNKTFHVYKLAKHK
ncbi:probable C-mannosyltransferase DPY19L3 isoform X5 [Onychostruthus taczanowskii]|uniref:probable C-mannosyltransferase DPY19L3 isoform X5 n=1 Tax=Onychostruthus taczanowskii TaxID=356909 RepID=UPI001B80119F|nr:probable C-mannosyltransferase DPY19L3 isoform X5 [Onychostruthus taczanowskii]